MDDKPDNVKRGNRLLVFGAVLLTGGIALSFFSRSTQHAELTSLRILLICLGGAGLFTGFTLRYVRISKVETAPDPRTPTNRVKLALLGFLAGLPVGYTLLFYLSRPGYLFGLLAVGVIGAWIALRRGTNLAKDWHIMGGGFVVGYGIIYSLYLFALPIAGMP
jgi:hypothetical protein